MVKTVVKKFKELSLEELYQILRLRSEVFVVEQDCVYQDLDNKDQKALHLFLKDNNEIIAYTRLFDTGLYFNTPSIGRVVVKKTHRKGGIGHYLLKESIDAIYINFSNSTITISAQTYLRNYYESHGFKKTGEEYLEDGIPHIKMIKE